MNAIEQNKQFILEYFHALSGKEKPRSINEKYITDTVLIDHILFFEAILPKYEIFADEMVGEGNKVVVRARVKAIHKGAFNGIPATNKPVEFSFAIRYTIENDKIVDHWLISDQTEFLEQIGVMETQAETHS